MSKAIVVLLSLVGVGLFTADIRGHKINVCPVIVADEIEVWPWGDFWNIGKGKRWI